MKTPGAKRILVVEDETSIANLCRRILTSDGFEVDIAANGEIAQGMLGKGPYHLCLIDIRMPAMDGKELYRWIEGNHSELTKEVVFTTGDMLSRDTQSFLEQVGKPFLPKPFSPDDLKVFVREALKETGYGRRKRYEENTHSDSR